jgi:hypothetical protein
MGRSIDLLVDSLLPAVAACLNSDREQDEERAGADEMHLEGEDKPGLWSEAEETKLTEMVAESGTSNWGDKARA